MLNIAVLEDNHALREMLCELLISQGHNAWGAFDSAELDERIANSPMDLLLLDLGLPGEDGFSVARRLRSVMPDLHIIITSAKSTVNDRVRGYECGADVYMPKPVSEDELLAAVASVDRRVQAQRSASAPGVPQLDVLAQTLTGEAQVSLTRTEANVLRVLASAQGQQAPTHLLLESLGKPVDDKSKASLEVQITYLRKKLEQACPGVLRVRAVRGEGYQLVGRLRLLAG